jgi:hypothetical protein
MVERIIDVPLVIQLVLPHEAWANLTMEPNTKVYDSLGILKHPYPMPRRRKVYDSLGILKHPLPSLRADAHRTHDTLAVQRECAR